MGTESVDLPPGPGASLSLALLRLVEVVEQENAVLEGNGIMLHAGFTDRKNQALRDLMAAQRSEGVSDILSACRPLLDRLSAALRANTSLLKVHITAVGEISDIIIGGLREAESDGTYSRARSRT